MAWLRNYRVSCLITSGTSLSSPVHNGGSVLQSIYVAGWDTATIAFAVSDDNVTYKPLLKDNTELTISVTADKELHSANLEFLVGHRYVKIQSGTSGTPVNQTADRTLYLSYLTEV